MPFAVTRNERIILSLLALGLGLGCLILVLM
jgi:hypothetical protein